MKVTQISRIGTYGQGLWKGQNYLRVSIKGGMENIRISEKVAKEAIGKDYCKVSTTGLKDIYNTSNGDSSNVYPEFLADGVTAHPKAGTPIYTKDEKLTVEEYFNRRGEEPREFNNFAGFLTSEESALWASKQVLQMEQA